MKKWSCNHEGGLDWVLRLSDDDLAFIDYHGPDAKVLRAWGMSQETAEYIVEVLNKYEVEKGMKEQKISAMDANELHQYYAHVPLYGGQTMGFPSSKDIELLVRTARHAAVVMAYLNNYGPNIVGHLMDDDENPGERLREDLRALGFWG